MNWIKLLYPHPHFEPKFGPLWMRRIHTIALTIAYYLVHTVGLVGLALIYSVILIPLKLGSLLRGQDLLSMKLDSEKETYLLESEDLSKMDFKRMY